MALAREGLTLRAWRVLLNLRVLISRGKEQKISYWVQRRDEFTLWTTTRFPNIIVPPTCLAKYVRALHSWA